MTACSIVWTLLICLYPAIIGTEGNDMAIAIDGETYSVMEAPSETSKLVNEETKRVLDQVNLTQLTNELKIMGTFMSIAYQGVEDFPVIQGKVQSMAIRVTKLTDKTSVTILEFERACITILENLQAVYQYLLLDMEKTAHNFMVSIAEVAEEMVTASQNLEKQYSAEVDNVQVILEEAFMAKGVKQEEIKKLREDINKFNILLAEAKTAKENALEAEKKAEYYFQQAKDEEQEALEEQANPWKRAINFVTSSTLGFQVFDLGAYKTAAEAASAEKYKFLAEMQRYQSIRVEQLKIIAASNERIKNAKDDTELADVVLESLRNAMGGLKNVAIVLMDAATFWDAMKGHIASLQKHGLHKEIEFVMSEDNTKERPWKTDYFKGRAVRFCSRWVALYRVCKEFRSNMHEVQQDLRDVVRLNPTKEQALRNVRELAIKFGPQLQNAINQIESEHETRMKKNEL